MYNYLFKKKSHFIYATALTGTVQLILFGICHFIRNLLVTVQLLNSGFSKSLLFLHAMPPLYILLLNSGDLSTFTHTRLHIII